MTTDDFVIGVSPFIADPDTSGFFAAAARGVLALCRCLNCERWIHLPVGVCSECGGTDVTWQEVEGRGTLYSWTTVTHQVHPGFPPPFTVVLVEIDDTDGARLVGRLAGAPALRAGQAMVASFEAAPDGTALVAWRPE